jgi:hypothetical protein
MKGFERRLAKLERVITGKRVYVLCGPAEMPTDAAIAAVGIKPRPCDLVIYCKNFVDDGATPELLHVRHTD